MSRPTTGSARSTDRRKSFLPLAPVLATLWVAAMPCKAQSEPLPVGSAPQQDLSLSPAMRFRHIGPYRGGRSTAVAGIADRPFTFYMGSTGGGVFKTTDAGTTWHNVSDGYFAAGSIGAVAVAASDSDIVYVGTGSACPRGNVSPGIGMYRSTDDGATWQHIGLPDAGQIAKLAVHPGDSDLVYAAVLGHIFGPNEQRGVFRSRDGGEHWEQVLFLDDETGAVDIKMDPSDPDVLYAAMWRAERKPWTIVSGGPVGGIYKSEDGGDTWRKLTEGLPQGMTGRIGIAVSPANPQRIWAIIEGERIVSGFPRDESGMYRSDDAGRTWTHLSADPELHQRPWYYHHLVADPLDDGTVYHVGDNLWKSTDGGVTFDTLAVPHVDQHDLWINPHDPGIMIEASDGGGIVTLNGGETWSSQLNQPTAEVYRIGVDNDFPYRVYAGQQDYSTISLPSRVFGAGGITLQHWGAVGGGEMGPVAVDPHDSGIVYAGGNLSRFDAATGQVRRIAVYPEYWSGVPAAKLKYRVPFDAPISVSKHEPGVVYTTSQYVHRSTDGGQRWEVVSPDLTRNDPDKIVISGGPLTRDITSVETYCTIFAFAESPLERGLLWAGSDDGLVHMSRDSGSHWDNVTPPGMPEWGRVNTIDLSSHTPGRALVSVTRYKLDDFRPYVFLTDDYGANWRQLADGNGIPATHFVRVAREDPGRAGLLYAGSEFGLYISFDDGRAWQPFQLNLPLSPVSDIVVHRNDLILATQGRGFWILDDVTPLHTLDRINSDRPFLFEPRESYRVEGGWRQPGPYVSEDNYRGGIIETSRVGENAPPGALLFYYLPTGESDLPATLEILGQDGHTVRRFSSEADDGLTARPGMNRFVWDLTYPGADVIPGSRLDGYIGGPPALPGRYRIRLATNDFVAEQSLVVRADPRSRSTLEDLQAQFDLVQGARDGVSAAHAMVRNIRDIRAELATSTAVATETADLRQRILADLDRLEDKLRQKRAKVWQDTANFEPLIDDQFAWLAYYTLSAETRPTDAARERFDDLAAKLALHRSEFERIMQQDLRAYRAQVNQSEDES